jgi:hypothetical protein
MTTRCKGLMASWSGSRARGSCHIAQPALHARAGLNVSGPLPDHDPVLRDGTSSFPASASSSSQRASPHHCSKIGKALANLLVVQATQRVTAHERGVLTGMAATCFQMPAYRQTPCGSARIWRLQVPAFSCAIILQTGIFHSGSSASN